MSRSSIEPPVRPEAERLTETPSAQQPSVRDPNNVRTDTERGSTVIVPSYAELRTRRDGPPGSSWNVFTTDPERGTANFAGPDQIRHAAGAVSTGEVFTLDYALNAFDPPMARARGVPRHEILSSHPEARDDVLRDFFLQATTQVDGLRHRRASGYGFYNGVPDDLIAVGTPALGVQKWAEKPIVGRGVLIDIEGWAPGTGAPLDHFTGPALPAGSLDEALRAQGTELQPGDLVLVHTGWARWFLGADNQHPHAGPGRPPQHRIPAEPRAAGMVVGQPGRPVRHRHVRGRGAPRGHRQPVYRHRAGGPRHDAPGTHRETRCAAG